MGPYLSVFSSSFLALLSMHGQLISIVQTSFLSWLTSRASIRFALTSLCSTKMGIYLKTPHSWCDGRLVLASPVTTMVEPLLLTHALAGTQKTESSKLHYACIGTWFVRGRNIQPIHVQRSQLPFHITCIGLRRRWRFASPPLFRAS